MAPWAGEVIWKPQLIPFRALAGIRAPWPNRLAVTMTMAPEAM
jgi:hypothetical protein